MKPTYKRPKRLQHLSEANKTKSGVTRNGLSRHFSHSFTKFLIECVLWHAILPPPTSSPHQSTVDRHHSSTKNSQPRPTTLPLQTGDLVAHQINHHLRKDLHRPQGSFTSEDDSANCNFIFKIAQATTKLYISHRKP